MQTTLPTGCGNAPRVEVVAEIVSHWAQGDAESLAEWLADEMHWTIVGGDSPDDADDDAAHIPMPSAAPDHLVFLSIITHGRLASCDGYLETAGTRSSFSHVFRFASTSKTAKVTEVRSFIVSL